ncbi:hypothetical protein F5Y11DRAFT_168169 [Daldinia sp. FL1419]|nr:hypothetical protein F5Y11DRAFT_168169 [Daldinia sp. FL1419]
MCVEVWNTFRGCTHRLYQNTSLCHVARRCDPKDDMVLDHTKFLPDQPSKLPPGMLQCKRTVALRPKDTPCPECAKEQHRAANSQGKTWESSSSSPDDEQTRGSPSRAAERVRDSLMLLEQFRKMP